MSRFLPHLSHLPRLFRPAAPPVDPDVAYVFTPEQRDDLRRRQALLDHYTTMLTLMREDFYRTVTAACGRNLEAADYTLDLDTGVLRDAQAPQP